jgi:HK97 family phage portal protein
VTILRALARGSEEARAIQATAWGDWGDGGTSWSGTRVDNVSALQLLTVYGCNRFICDGISTLPVDALRDTDKGVVEVSKPGWLSQPTVDLDFIAWCTQVLTSLLMDGNAYCWVRRTAAGDVDELVPLNPSAVSVRRERGKRSYLVNGQPVDGYEILHIPGVMFPGSEKGLSPIEAARQTIGKGSSVEEFAARFFGQGLDMAGVVEIPAGVDMTDDQAKAMANSLARRHSGKGKAHLPGVLTAGATWKSTGVTNEQAQFLQTRGSRPRRSLVPVPHRPVRVRHVGRRGSGSITYANLEQRNARKVQVTFLPWIIRIENALSALIRQSNRYVKFNVNGLVRADLAGRYSSYQVGISSKFLTPNEARGWENLPPLDGGDEVVTPPASMAPAASDDEPAADEAKHVTPLHAVKESTR